MPEMPDASDASARNGIVIAFDYGLAQIGVAIGQTQTQSARPLQIIKAKDGIPNWQQLEQLFAEWQPVVVVVGLPLNMDESDSDMAIRARKFANRVHGRFGLAVELQDERLSSREAKARVREQASSTAQALEEAALSFKRENTVDAVAAQVILESWFTAQG